MKYFKFEKLQPETQKYKGSPIKLHNQQLNVLFSLTSVCNGK